MVFNFIKSVCILPLVVLSFTLMAKSGKGNFVRYNRITDVEGTPYVIATVDKYRYKLYDNTGSDILFINTVSGERYKLPLPEGSKPGRVEQVKLDSLGINLLILTARTVNLDHDKGIDWQDPNQIFFVSVDGRKVVQVTDDQFFEGTWALNRKTGAIVVAGTRDSNHNNRLDNDDESEVVIFDLKAMKRIGS